MKMDVTIPDPIFEAADLLAARLGMSRSELVARALEDFTRQHEAGAVELASLSSNEITRRINEGLIAAGRDSSELDNIWKAARNRGLAKEDW